MQFSQLRNKKFVNVTHVILAIIAIAGFTTAAPGIGILAKPLLMKKPHKDTLRQRLYDLKHSGYIQKDPRGYRLTKKGQKRLQRYEIKTLVIQKKQRWDKRWRIVLFDIPESRSADRNAFRQALKNLGFYPLQESVFLHPYPCEAEVLLLCRQHRLQRYICFLEAENLPTVSEKTIRKKYFS